MEQPDKATQERWHCWFAVECNNQAWDLAAAPTRSAEENRQMLYTAYAAAFHWKQAGQPVHQARAETLLAQVHALLGQGNEALHYARSCLEFFEGNASTDWDLAFAHAQMAMAAHAVGDTELHAGYYAQAKKLGEAIEDEADHKIFMAEFARVPAP